MLMITVCEKQTYKQILRLLGSIGPKKGPRANNKLERNLLSFGQHQAPAEEDPKVQLD